VNDATRSVEEAPWGALIDPDAGGSGLQCALSGTALVGLMTLAVGAGDATE
jgi:hypothetical protein